MEYTYNDFGLSGQQAKGEYDNFLCLGKKCKQRKKERHQARMAKRNAKTDARKADTERVRAESQVIQQAASNASSSSPVITMPLTRQEITPPNALASSDATEKKTNKDSSPSNVIIVVIGVSLLGACLYLFSKNKQAAMNKNKLPLAA